MQLLNDGQQFHAKRLSVTHSDIPPMGRGNVAVAVRTSEGLDDAGFAAFRRKFATASTSAEHQGSVVSLNAESAMNPLALSVDLVSGKVLRSAGSDTATRIAPLTVNGRKIDFITP